MKFIAHNFLLNNFEFPQWYLTEDPNGAGYYCILTLPGVPGSFFTQLVLLGFAVTVHFTR